jgi:hypothetical protein
VYGVPFSTRGQCPPSPPVFEQKIIPPSEFGGIIVSALLHTDHEARPNSQSTLDGYIPAIEPYDTLDDRESDTCSWDFAAAVRTIKSLKYSFLLLICHTDSCISNSEFFSLSSYSDIPSVYIVPDSIGYEVREEDLEVFFLYGYGSGSRDIEFYCQALFLDMFMLESDDFFYVFLEVQHTRLGWCLQIREFDESIERVCHRVYGR